VAVLGLTRVTAAALPAGVAGLTARAALQFSNRTPAAGAVPTAAASLAEGVLNAMIRSKLKVAAAGLLALALAVTGPVLIADPTAKADPPPKPAAAAPAKPKELSALEQKLVGRWIGRGMFASVFTYRADGTFLQDTLNEKGEGTWAFEWDALPPTLVRRWTKSDLTAVPVGTVHKQRVLALDDKQLAFENPEAAGLGGFGLRPIGYKRITDAPAGGEQPGPKGGAGSPAGDRPGRADVVGEWRSHNGLAGVFFNLELKDDETFTLSHREVAPKLDLVIAGKWSHDGDRVTLQEERQLVDGKRVEVEGGLFFPRGRTDTLTVARKDGRWVVTHGRGIEFTRYTPPKGGGPKP
jgi:hypothetical protein